MTDTIAFFEYKGQYFATSDYTFDYDHIMDEDNGHDYIMEEGFDPEKGGYFNGHGKLIKGIEINYDILEVFLKDDEFRQARYDAAWKEWTENVSDKWNRQESLHNV